MGCTASDPSVGMPAARSSATSASSSAVPTPAPNAMAEGAGSPIHEADGITVPDDNIITVQDEDTAEMLHQAVPKAKCNWWNGGCPIQPIGSEYWCPLHKEFVQNFVVGKWVHSKGGTITVAKSVDNVNKLVISNSRVPQDKEVDSSMFPDFGGQFTYFGHSGWLKGDKLEWVTNQSHWTKALRWRVVHEGVVNVREEAARDASVIKQINHADEVYGIQTGDWLKLSHEPGYILLTGSKGQDLVQRAPQSMSELLSMDECAKVRSWAASLTTLAFFLKSSGLATPQLELQPITQELKIKIKSFPNTWPEPIRVFLLEHHAYLESGVGLDKVEDLIKTIQKAKDAIKADKANKTSNGDVWEEEYKKAKASEWAAALA